MKINLGAGATRFPDFVNCDVNNKFGPEYVFDIEKDTWPFEDNSVTHVKAYHVLEHLGEGYFHALKELYRVCKPNAHIDIQVPHYRHSNQLHDPTHRRLITPMGLRLFSKEFNDNNPCASSKLGYHFDVDFKILSSRNILDRDNPHFHYIETLSPSELEVYAYDRNNVFSDTHIELQVIKPYRIANVQYNNHNFDFYTHGSADRIVSQNIYDHGVWEKQLTDIWYNHIRPGDLVLDIGANIGWYTRIANLKGATAIAVEPDPKNFSLLQKNGSNNNEYHNVCAGNSTDDIGLKLSDHNYGDNRTSTVGDIVCKQTTIDNLVGERASKIRAIKIDTQGWEPNIILGALNTLNNAAEDCLIIIEYYPWMLAQNGFTSDSYRELFKIFTGNLMHFPAPVDWDSNKNNPDVYCDMVAYKK